MAEFRVLYQASASSLANISLRSSVPKRRLFSGLASMLTGVVIVVVTAPTLLAVDPGNSAGADPFPSAVWIASQGDVAKNLLRNPAGTDGKVDIFDHVCSGTLIAPDLVVTAAHCFRGQGLAATPTIGFGITNANNQVGTATIHPNWAIVGGPVSGPPKKPAPGTPSDLTVVRLPNPVLHTMPSPLMLRAPIGNSAVGKGDVAFFAGYGGRHDPPKRWSGPPHDNVLAPVNPWDIDAVSAEFTYVRPKQGANEANTEGGDSGGPEFISAKLKNKFNFTFVTSANQGSSLTPPGKAFKAKTHTRIDRQATASGGASGTSNVKFIHDNMPNPTSITINHNMPADPVALATLDPDASIAVYIEATYPQAARPSYLFSPMLFEDDFDLLAPNNFSGDMALRPTDFADDLVGYGYATGVLAAGVTKVIAWDTVSVSDLVPYDEAGNPLDPPQDWILDFNSSLLQFDLANGTAPAGHTLATATFKDIQTMIQMAKGQFKSGTAVEGQFMMIPEPSSFILFSVGLFALFGVRHRSPFRD